MVTGSSFRYALQVLFLLLLTGMSQNSGLYHRRAHQVKENSVTVA